MTREKIVDRIAKLLRLSENNDSVEEAALAATRAQELMLQHQIDAATLSSEMDEAEEELEELVMDSVFEGTRRSHWKTELWYGVCNGNNCVGYTWGGQRHKRSFSKGVRMAAVGRQSNVETSVYMFKWLLVEIDKLAKEAVGAKGFVDRGDARRYGNSFRVGAATEIRQRLCQMKTQVYSAAERRGQSTALVLVKNDAIAVANQAPALMAAAGYRVSKKGRYQGGSITSRGGFYAGRKAAQNISLGGNKQLGASKRRLRD